MLVFNEMWGLVCTPWYFYVIMKACCDGVWSKLMTYTVNDNTYITHSLLNIVFLWVKVCKGNPVFTVWFEHNINSSILLHWVIITQLQLQSLFSLGWKSHLQKCRHNCGQSQIRRQMMAPFFSQRTLLSSVWRLQYLP